MTTINDTVDQALTTAGYGQYRSYAQPVVTALVNREEQIVGRLIEFATQNGMAEGDVRDALRGLDMQVPTPPTAAAATVTASSGATTAPASAGTPGSDDDPVLRMLSDIQQQIAGLTEFARRNGYSG